MKELELIFRIVLEEPNSGVDFGLQHGKGNDYQTIDKQRSKSNDIILTGSVMVKDNREDGQPNFLGPLAQGPADGRFVYVDVGQYAGQKDSEWGRRMKIPFTSITWDLLNKAKKGSQAFVETRFAGIGKDGGPTCGTVKNIRWLVAKK